MEPYDAYRYYMAIKLHFESATYDAVKYHYKTNTNAKAFWKRRDKYQFAKIARRFTSIDELIGFYVAHFIKGSKWVGNMLDSDESYTEWRRKQQSLSYVFDQDMAKLSDVYGSFDDLFAIDSSPYPEVVNKYMQEQISIETVAILDRLTNFLNRVEVDDTILYPEIKMRIRKYEPFIYFDTKKMKAIILKHFTS